MEKDIELKKQLGATSRNVLKILRKIAKKLKIKDPEIIEFLTKDFEYCRKTFALITSAEYVFWAYEFLSEEKKMPSATECVKNCLRELSAMLNEVLAENDSNV